MNKFIIVDQSLCNLYGYNYERSVSLAKVAAQREYEPIIIANKVFSQELYPPDIKVISTFEVDCFNNSTIENNLPLFKKYLKKINNAFQELSFEEIWSNILIAIDYKLLEISLKKPQWQLFIEKIQGSTFRLGNWFQKDLTLLKYIPFANSFWGLLKIVFGLFRFIIGKIFKLFAKIWLKLFQFPEKKFIDSLKKTLQKIKVSPQDHIFIYTLGTEQLQQLLSWLESLNPISIPNYHLVFTKDINNPLFSQSKTISLEACLNRFYNSNLSQDKVNFYADTEKLVERYNTLSAIQFTKIYLPFNQEKIQEYKKFKNQNQSINILYLDEFTKEKGFHLLPQIVSDLWKDYIATKKVKFIIQSIQYNSKISHQEKEILTAKLQLQQYPEDAIIFNEEAINIDSYYKLLNDANLVIMPYDINAYRYQVSNIFIQSLVTGKPVIVPANSWLAMQIDKTRGNSYQASKNISKTIIKVIKNLEQYSQSASKFSLIWQKKYSADSFFNCLLNHSKIEDISQGNKVELTPINNVPKILYIAQGDNLVQKNIQGLITLTHLEYLSKCGYQIYLVVYGLDTQFRKENFDNFVEEIKQIIKSYTFAENWILNFDSGVSFLEELDENKYVQQVYNQQLSLSRNLVDINSLNLPSFLTSYLQAQNLNIVFIDNIASWILVEKLSLSNIPLIYQMFDFYSYQYAIENNHNLDEEEWNLEQKLLAKCQLILCAEEQKLIKIKGVIPQSSFYLLPSTILINHQVNLSDEYQLLNFIWKHENNQYEEVMNNAFYELLGKETLSLQKIEKIKKIAILYPWGDILERKAGASKRVGLLIDYLQAKNHQIWLFTAGDKPEFFDHKVRYTFYQQKFENLDLIKEVYTDTYNACLQSQSLNSSGKIQLINPEISAEINQDWRLSMYYQFRFDANFINYIEDITDWADVVILEYPFWAKTVSKICKEKQVKLIITAHDAIYKQVPENSAISQILLTEEISGLQTANQVISVSYEDQKLFNQYQINSIVIPNPVELPKNDLIQLENIPLNITKEHPWLEENYCLFVGSKHFPNLEAVNQIRNIASIYSKNKEYIPCKFIIVGTCCEPENNHNFISLGKVNFELLKILYQQANLIISPMLSGTGSSLKIMEAMGYEKSILGTKIAFRGYPVESEFNCILSDEITDYPTIINNLLLDPKKLNLIGENAQKLAQNYDYCQVYQAYDQLISIT